MTLQDPKTALLNAEGLTKSYGETYHLGPVDLAFEAGETVGILGQNGAGKSTFFQLLTGNLDPSAGKVFFAGKRLTPDTPELKRHIGYLPQNHALPRWSTSREILSYAADLYELPDVKARVAQAERYWDAARYGDKPLMALSYGMQKRTALALATLHDPECLILDEPFSGLDLYHIKTLEGEIQRRGAAGKLTILSTHVAAFCARLCQRAFLIKAGQVAGLDGWESASPMDRERLIEGAFFRAQSLGPAHDSPKAEGT